MSNNSQETFFGGLLSDKWTKILLLIGLLLLIVNVVVPMLANTRLSTILFAFNMQYWSIHFSLFLWIAAIWAVLESIESLEDNLPIIRLVAGAAILSIIILANPIATGLSAWQSAIVVITACCVVRSLHLLYVYWNDGADYIDMEEAQWFWGMSGFICTVWLFIGVAHLIPITENIQSGVDTYMTMTTTLYSYCRTGLQELVRAGAGSAGIRILAFLLVPISLAFVYVASKWGLVFLSRFRGD